MENVTFRQDEVLAFLEDKIIQGEANDDEVEFYQECQLHGTGALNTYKLVLKEMRKEYDGGN